MSWVNEAKARAQLEDVLAAAGLEERGSGWTPCPACGAERRSRSDGRAPVTVFEGERESCWRCWSCQASGDALALAAAAVTGAVHPAEWAPVRAWLAGRGWCSGVGDPTPELRPPRPPRRSVPPPPRRPPRGELAELWLGAQPVLDDAQAVAWLGSRGLDPALVEDLDLARALPSGSLPSWAGCGGRSWARSGHRLLVPLFDAQGALQSVQARYVGEGKPWRKALNPSGYQVGGLVMADAQGQRVLAGQAEARAFVVAEGVPDFLTWASRWGEASGLEQAPVVLGLAAGGWVAEIAARIPDGARVAIWTHADEAGDDYAEAVRATLAGRCELRRAG